MLHPGLARCLCVFIPSLLSDSLTILISFGCKCFIRTVNKRERKKRKPALIYSHLFQTMLFFSSLQRNQFLEAESIELEKERTQIRFEMRNLLVNNEDLLRMNSQLQAELNRMRDRIVELESDNNVMVERFKQIDVRNSKNICNYHTLNIKSMQLNRFIQYVVRELYNTCTPWYTPCIIHMTVSHFCLFCRWN